MYDPQYLSVKQQIYHSHTLNSRRSAGLLPEVKARTDQENEDDMDISDSQEEKSQLPEEILEIVKDVTDEEERKKLVKSACDKRQNYLELVRQFEGPEIIAKHEQYVQVCSKYLQFLQEPPKVPHTVTQTAAVVKKKVIECEQADRRLEKDRKARDALQLQLADAEGKVNASAEAAERVKGEFAVLSAELSAMQRGLSIPKIQEINDEEDEDTETIQKQYAEEANATILEVNNNWTTYYQELVNNTAAREAGLLEIIKNLKAAGSTTTNPTALPAPTLPPDPTAFATSTLDKAKVASSKLAEKAAKAAVKGVKGKTKNDSKTNKGGGPPLGSPLPKDAQKAKDDAEAAVSAAIAK